jgi:hypothetical protein
VKDQPAEAAGPFTNDIKETEPADQLQDVPFVLDIDPSESFTVRKDEKTREAERIERSAKLEGKRPKPKASDGSEPISNWFTRQFNTLFTESDSEIDQ